MKPREIVSGVKWMGVIDWHRQLFDALIPLPDGTSYNSYLVEGSEKTALIDTVDPPFVGELLENLSGVKKLDYIVANHAEQDHSGSLPEFLARWPEAKVVCSEKCRGMLIDLLALPEDRFLTVADGETLSLGDRTLRFIFTPWVHWPETISTYLEEEKILFSCDFFGSHLATTDLYATDWCRIHEAAKRYYGEIMMPFRMIIGKNLEKIKDLEMELICPSHGPIYDRPELIVKAYRDWVSGPLKKSVVLPFVSMHGSTAKMTDHLLTALVERGLSVHPFDLTVADPGKLVIALVDASALALGTPTVLAGPHPLAANAAVLVNALKPRLECAAIFGSYGWGGKTVETLTSLLANLKAEMLEPVLGKGLPGPEDFSALDRMAEELAGRING
ncbi:MAG: FprA family A-type flavoprotein [Candidatus Erginobacter occultus]|nr:FprA family A-type flavoprotein [Candidatus Erginobacter occultus]